MDMVGNADSVIWTITMIEDVGEVDGLPWYGQPRTLGWYRLEEAARFYIEAIAGRDAAIGGYKYVVMERYAEGVFPIAAPQTWWYRDGERFVQIEKPAVMSRIVNIGMG